MLSELETQLQDVMLRDQFRFRRQFAHLKRAERQQRLNEDELLKLAIRIERSIALRAKDRVFIEFLNITPVSHS